MVIDTKEYSELVDEQWFKVVIVGSQYNFQVYVVKDTGDHTELNLTSLTPMFTFSDETFKRGYFGLFNDYM